MRRPLRGWRSARGQRVPTTAAAPAGTPPFAVPFPYLQQQPLKIGLGLLALTFYLWIIHSYKLPAVDVAVIGMALGVLVRGGTIRIPFPLACFGILILWGCLGLAVTDDAGRTLDALIDLGKLWIIAFCVVNVVRTAADFRYLVIAWLAVFALYPVRGALYNQYICHCTTLGRVTWNFVFGNPNDLAALTMVPLGLCAGVATVERTKFFRMSALAGVVILSMIILLTQSRAAILGLGAAALMLLFTSRRKVRDIGTLVALLGAAIVFAPKKVWERVAGLANVSVEADMQGVDPEASAESRWAIWQVAIRTVGGNPVTGIGASMMPVRHEQESSRENLRSTVRGEKDTHSTYLKLAAEMGVPALILYLMMWGSVFRRVHRARKSIAGIRPKDHQVLFYLQLAMTAFMVASIFGSYGAVSFTYLIVCVAWLAAEILGREPWYVSPQTAMKLQAQAVRGR